MSRGSAIPNRALLLPLGGRKSKPGFGERPSALERALQIGLLALNRLAANFVRHFNGRSDDQHHPGEWPGKLKKVPGVFEGMRVLGKNMEGDNRAAAAASQNNRPRFGKIARATRTIGGKGHVVALAELRGKHGEPAQAAAGRASIGGGKAQPLKRAAEDLAIEIRAGHGRDAAMAPPPHGEENCLMPEGINAAAIPGVQAIDVLPAQHFVSQGGADHAGEGICRGGNNGNLRTTSEGKLFWPRIVGAWALSFTPGRRLGQLRHAL